jgi:hypothetical protein
MRQAWTSGWVVSVKAWAPPAGLLLYQEAGESLGETSISIRKSVASLERVQRKEKSELPGFGIGLPEASPILGL